MKELRVWKRYTLNSLQQALANRTAFVLFTTGKLLRIVMFLVFLSFIFQGNKNIGGYNREQIIFFYLSFNLIDTLAQLMFREVYRFRDLVVTGDLDLVLTKPIHPLIRLLLGGFDPLDLSILFLIVCLTIWYGVNNISHDPALWLLYALLMLNGLVIATAFHILALGIGILSTSIDHLMMVYRDFTAMFRIPADLYIEPVRFLLTFIIPFGIMITFPAKALMGALSVQFMVLALIIGIVSFFLALKFWNYSLKQYSSASS